MATLPEILAGQGESLVVHNHLQQMVTFARAGGIEFVAQTDSGGVRKVFLDRLVRKNRLKTRLKGQLVRMIKGGKLLLYLRPVADGYRIQDYASDSYRAYYDADGELDSVVIIYSYKVQTAGQAKDCWVKLRLTKDLIDKQEGDAKPEFEQTYNTQQTLTAPIANSLGFLPCVEVLNPVPASDKEGVSDFEELSARIEAHDDMTTAIVDNLDFFCRSPLLTSRAASDVSEGIGMDELHQGGVAYASGFRPPGQAATGRRRSSRKIKRVIGDIDEGEMFQQLAINAVPSDLLNFATGYESQLRESLGGILERSINTAAETAIVYGKVQATAAEKQEALYTLGLCEILEMAIFAEENLYVASGGAIGLPDMGDRTVNWRAAPVFVESTNDINLRTISARNLMKFVGVSAKEALKYTFPGKSDSELDVMVGDGGFPSDYLSTAIDMLQKLNQAIDPLTQMPITNPTTGLPLSSLLLPFIINNLNYGQQFSTQPNNDSPGNADPNAALSAALATVARLQQPAINGLDGLGTAAVREPLELPAPGSTVSQPASTNPNDGGFLDFSRSPVLNAVKSIF
jgi:hypothetical protein